MKKITQADVDKARKAWDKAWEAWKEAREEARDKALALEKKFQEQQ